MPSSWLRAGGPHQLSSISWPRAALKLALGWCPAPGFQHQLAQAALKAGAGHQPAPAFKHQLASICLQAGCGLVSRTSFQAPAGLEQPSKLAAGWCPAPAFKHQLAQAALKAGAGHQPAPAFKHQLASICLQAGCGLVSRSSFQAPADLEQPSSWLRAGVLHQLSSTSWLKQPSKLVRDTSPHQLSSTNWTSICRQGCGLVSRTSFQAPAGLEQPSSWLRAGVPHQLSNTSWLKQPSKLLRAFKHQLASICLQAGCGLVSRTSFQAPAGLEQPSSWLRAGVPHQLSSTRWLKQPSKLVRDQPHQLSSTSWPRFGGCGLVSRTSFQAPPGLKQPSKLVREPAHTSFAPDGDLPSSWLRAGVPHQLSSTSWPRAALKLASRTSFPPAGLEQPSSWLRAGVPHQLSSISWPRAALKLAAGWCPAPAFKHQLAQTALKAGAGHQPAPAFKHQLASICLQAGCGLVSRTSFQAPAGLEQPSSWLRAGVPHQLSSTAGSSSPQAGCGLVAPAGSSSPQSWCGTPARTSFQAPAGLDLPSSWLRAGVLHQLSSTSWPRAALKLAAGWCPAPAFKHQLAQAALKAGAGHQPAPAFSTSWPRFAFKLAAGLVSRNSFQAPAGLEQPSSWLWAGVPHQLSSTSWLKQLSKLVRDTSPHQLTSTSWPRFAFKLAAGWCPAPAFKHQLAHSPQSWCGTPAGLSRTSFQAPTNSSSPQSWCGTPARTIQAPAGLDLPSSWLRAGVPHQL